ncbi:hypothetical protein [Flavobacterium sp.]|uniref:hypothetical protein n=1 Tax=Flavobacterium sp. TaxID=239 RepID=UPI003D102924
MNSFYPIIKRFSLLTLAQALITLFPLTLYFLLLNRIEIIHIGAVFSWQTTFIILASLSNYNFPLNLIPISKKIKESPLTLNIYLNRCFSLRMFFFILLFLPILILLPILPNIALYSSFLLLGKLFNPSIFLTTLAKSKQLFIFNFLTKFFALIGVYFLIQNNNWYWTNFIIGFAELAVSIGICIHLRWQFNFKIEGFWKTITYLKQEKKVFFIQCVHCLIVFLTIPLTHLFYGPYVAGVVSLADKLLSVVKNISGSLFFTILPNFEISNNDYKKQLLTRLNKLLFGMCCLGYFISIILIQYNSNFINDKFTHNDSIPFLHVIILTGFPIILVTPYQILSFKIKNNKNIFTISLKQIAIQILGLIILGNLWGILGIAFSILAHEFITFYLYKNEQNT